MNHPDKKNIPNRLLDAIHQFRTSSNLWAGLGRDLLFVAIMVVLFMVLSQVLLGNPRPAVAVESGSMSPHITKGDIVIIQSVERTDIITYQEGATSGYESFEKFGDVILFVNNGDTTQTPIIHRAMYWVDEGEPMWENGPPAPYSGYITKGDHNKGIDQYSHAIIEYHPIKKEWIIGVARWHIPYVGYLSLAIH